MLFEKINVIFFKENKSIKLNVNKNKHLDCINKKEINHTETLNTNTLHARF